MSDELLRGCPVSQELEARKPSSADSFVISTPVNGIGSTDYYLSRKLSYQTVKDDIYTALFRDLGLGSMATECSADYAQRLHDHFGRYSIVGVETYYGRDFDVPEEDDIVAVLGHVVVDGRNYDICAPKLTKDQIFASGGVERIGTLKFMCLPTMPKIDEDADEFDGWTYPDGREVSRTRFPGAYSVFGDKYGPARGGMFRLPTLNNFIKLNPLETRTDSMKEVPYNLAVKQHKHDISQVKSTGSFELTGSVKDYAVQDDFSGKHHGSPYDPDGTTAATVTFEIKDIKAGVSEGGTVPVEVDEENYPPYINIPVLMYIGEPAR